MPNAASRLCASPGCGETAVRQGRCPAHMRAEWRRVERYRGTAKARGYDEDWKRLRAAVLRVEPFCRACTAAGVIQLAQEVDHVVPLAEGGARLERANVQPLCRECHAAKTGTEHARRRA